MFAAPPSAVRLQLRKGSARVPRAIDGVSPSISLIHIYSAFGDKMVRRSLRRDAANHTRDACAPHFQLHRSAFRRFRNTHQRRPPIAKGGTTNISVPAPNFTATLSTRPQIEMRNHFAFYIILITKHLIPKRTAFLLFPCPKKMRFSPRFLQKSRRKHLP